MFVNRIVCHLFYGSVWKFEYDQTIHSAKTSFSRTITVTASCADRVFSAFFVNFSCCNFAFFAKCDAFLGPKNRAFVRCLVYSSNNRSELWYFTTQVTIRNSNFTKRKLTFTKRNLCKFRKRNTTRNVAFTKRWILVFSDVFYWWSGLALALKL